jgi:hypothetical protein
MWSCSLRCDRWHLCLLNLLLVLCIQQFKLVCIKCGRLYIDNYLLRKNVYFLYSRHIYSKVVFLDLQTCLMHRYLDTQWYRDGRKQEASTRLNERQKQCHTKRHKSTERQGDRMTYAVRDVEQRFPKLGPRTIIVPWALFSFDQLGLQKKKGNKLTALWNKLIKHRLL